MLQTPSHMREGKLRTFHTTCWVLGVLAFLELLGVGVALAMRLDRQAEPQILEKIVTIQAPSVSPPQVEADVAPQKGPRSVEEILETVKMPSLPPLNTDPIVQTKPKKPVPFFEGAHMQLPSIRDPKVERLVNEGRDLLIGQDVMRALLKLEEAVKMGPKEPQALYFLGQAYEQIGEYSKAGDYYEDVTAMGTDAGVLFPRAARKLAEGMVPDEDVMVGQMGIGLVQKFEDGHDVTLTIPVASASSANIDPTAVQLSVKVFVKDHKGQVRPINQSDRAQLENRWLRDVQDWSTGEESLRVTYSRPDRVDESQFYGYVLTLSYGNKVLDIKAKPRLLSRKVQEFIAEAQENAFPEGLPNFENLPGFFDDFNPANPLLPIKE